MSDENRFALFLINKGLYDSIEITKDSIDELIALLEGKVKLDVYCVKCKTKRVFSINENSENISLAEQFEKYKITEELSSDKLPWESDEEESDNDINWSLFNSDDLTKMSLIVISFHCSMDDCHKLFYIATITNNKMIKIGQYPSIADMSFCDLDEFRKDIDKASMKEFRRAIGLHAQGIGVGSYVYLRRIFERILDTAKCNAEADSSVDFSNYEKLKVVEKIKLLKDYLPDMISNNPIIYGIVSKGIHELSEDDCIKYFPVLKEAILMILRQWADKRKEQDAIKKLEASISTIATELS